MRELPAGLADRGRVDERHDPIDVLDHRAVEQPLVALLQRRELHVATDVPLHAFEIHHHPLHHLLLGADPVREQAAQAQPISFFRSKGDGTIECLVAQNVEAAFHDYSLSAYTRATTTGPQTVSRMLPIA